jgi:hypothetical protein
LHEPRSTKKPGAFASGFVFPEPARPYSAPAGAIALEAMGMFLNCLSGATASTAS